MPIFSKIMTQMGLVDRRKDGRVPVPGLEVLCGTGEQQQSAQIRDISATGIFLFTAEPMKPGTSTVLTLRRNTCTDVRLWARAVRQEGQGVGLTFGRTEADSDLWLKLMRMAAKLTLNDAVARFRVARALSFLARIATPVQDEIAELMGSTMNNERRERLIAMVLGVEERLERENRRIRTGISPPLIRDILLYGSAAEDKLTQSFWSQLLSSSCLPVYTDEESMRLVEILSNLLPVHLDIFTAACDLTIGGRKWNDFGELHCTLDEIREIAHTPNLNVIDQYLSHLCEQGLLGRTLRPRKGEQINHANLTVTMLGVELFARCYAPPGPEAAIEKDAIPPDGMAGLSVPK